MALCINDSGTWRSIPTQCVNDSGTWRKVITGSINDSGTWRTFGFGPPPPPPLGCPYEGGFLICCSAAESAYWVVAPSCTEVHRSWYLRNDAVTVAQACTGCSGWFIPEIAKVANPGYTCRVYWDSFITTGYWSNTEFNITCAYLQRFTTNFIQRLGKESLWYARAFRCITY